jgi:hypothetical protein
MEPQTGRVFHSYFLTDPVAEVSRRRIQYLADCDWITLLAEWHETNIRVPKVG